VLTKNLSSQGDRKRSHFKSLRREKDGWHIAKKSKRSTKMAKLKPADRQLEDDIWCLFYKLGFKELNSDRQCTVAIGAKSPPRQIDYFC
jgi:DNA sulfur modification protein DndB